MSEFITNSDPVTVHDWKPGNSARGYFGNRCTRLFVTVCDMMEQDALDNGGSGSDTWLALKQVSELLGKNKAFEAHQLAREIGLTLPGLKELAAEDAPLDWGDKADRNMMEYPHQN